MFISLWKQTHYGHFIISDLQITSSKLNTGFPFIKRTETTAFKPQLRGFLPFKKKTFPRTTYKSVHATHLQMLFEQHLKTIHIHFIPTTNNSEHPRKGRQKERAHLMSSSSSFHTMSDKAADSTFLHLAADLLRSSTQMIWHSEPLQSRHKTWDLTKLRQWKAQEKINLQTNTAFSLHLQNQTNRLTWTTQSNFSLITFVLFC